VEEMKQAWIAQRRKAVFKKLQNTCPNHGENEYIEYGDTQKQRKLRISAVRSDSLNMAEKF
jgi:hypothetical protein